MDLKLLPFVLNLVIYHLTKALVVMDGALINNKDVEWKQMCAIRLVPSLVLDVEDTPMLVDAAKYAFNNEFVVGAIKFKLDQHLLNKSSLDSHINIIKDNINLEYLHIHL